jgi:predicted MFS family arabinose efflux permease
MSVNNLATTGSAALGGWLYDVVGLNWLIAISAATTAACWLLVPWVKAEALAVPPRAGGGA